MEDYENFFRSDDMGMVTYLKLEGHTPQKIGYEGESCFWWFMITDSLLAAIESFGAREAQVEPREYSKMYAATKREFYDHYDRHEKG